MNTEDLVSLIAAELGEITPLAAAQEALLRLSADLEPEAASRAAALLPWLSALGRGSGALAFRLQGPEAVAAVCRESAWAPLAGRAVSELRRELLLERLDQRGDQDFCDALLEATEAAVAVLDAARDGESRSVGKRLHGLMPWLFELRSAGAALRSPEHEVGADGSVSRPLVDHLAERVLARKLLPLESGRWQQSGAGLSEAQIAAAAALLNGVREAGLLPCLRAALLHLDIAKARSETIHNLAAKDQLRHDRATGFATEGLLQRFSYFRDRPRLCSVCEELVGSHGLVGQHLRGETTAAMLEPWVGFIRGLDTAALGQELAGSASLDNLRRRVFELLVLVDLCDTAGVREGLMSEPLWLRFEAVHASLWLAVEGRGPGMGGLDTLDRRAVPGSPLAERLFDRLWRLRADRIAAGEPRETQRMVLDSLPMPVLEGMGRLLQTCQLWYCERATSELTVEGQLRLLCLAMRRAEIDPSLDESRPYHVDFRRLMHQLWPEGKLDAYRVRLLEALLEPLSLEAIRSSDAAVDALMPVAVGRHELGTFLGRIGEDPSIEIRFEPSAEAQALLTLLPIYERKRPAAFHATLKSLCDLYGLRKDEYDRVNNEASYLSTMNSARSDKSRMLDFVRPGKIVEVGPGGGVVLDLLEDRFPSSEVLGLDVSEMVVAALERKKVLEGRRWKVVQGDAFELASLFGSGTVSSVVFCSILHEIYSYVPWPAGPEGKPSLFQLGSVEAMVRAAYRCLEPGGRLLIRDGVQPADGSRIIRLKQPEGPSTLELYVREFEGRPIHVEWLAPDLVRMSSADAMAFLYTYTWGPEAFPYEVREQYGILTLEEYRKSLLRWLADADTGHEPRLVELPVDLQSYLQPGYIKGLESLVDLFDGDLSSLEELQPVSLPDSNCLLVVEKCLLP